MEISIENAGPYNCVRLYGRLDSRGAASIYDAVVGLGALEPGRVVLNLGAVTHATRAGCSAIFVAAKMLHTRTGAKLCVVDAAPDMERLLERAGFDHLITVQRHPVGSLMRAA